MAYLEGYRKISKEELQNKQSTLGKYPNSQVIISEPVELMERSYDTKHAYNSENSMQCTYM